MRRWRDSNPQPMVEVARACATLQILAAGISGLGRATRPLLYPLSYSNSRRWQESNLQPSEPDVTQAFTTPQTFPSSCSSLLHCFFNLPSARTGTLLSRSSFDFAALSSPDNFREESALAAFGIRTQSLAALYHRSIRELHHPGVFRNTLCAIYGLMPALQHGTFSPLLQFPRKAKMLERQIALDRNDLGVFSYSRVNKQ